MKSDILFIISMIIWGSIGVFAKNVEIPSMEMAFFRACIASIFLLISSIWFFPKDGIKRIKDNLKLLIFSGIALGFNWVLLFQSYKFTTITNSTLSYYMAPIFVALFSPIVLKEKTDLVKTFSIVGAFLGLFIILSHQNSPSGLAIDHTRGILFGLLAAVLYSCVIFANKLMKDLSGYEMTIVQISVAAIVLLPFVINSNNLKPKSGIEIVIILTLGILHTGFAYLIYFSSIKGISAQKVALLSYLDPISAVFFGTVLLREPFKIWHLLGTVMILGSTYLGSYNFVDRKYLHKIK